MKECGLLDGQEEISAFLKGAGKKKLYKWIAAGMPVRVEGGRWLAHKENIDEWVKHYTRTIEKGGK
ncbi:MAG: transcriptional regulator [Candidatus Marinimicrobia bacterium]|jgi:hypothetical protein|nr:transcriptional regulator [Candidatus Neomarinimicrobiota bacterium]